MWQFFVGAAIGFLCGVCFASLFAVSSRADRRVESLREYPPFRPEERQREWKKLLGGK